MLDFDAAAIARAKRPWFQLIKTVRHLARPRRAKTLRTILESTRDAMPLFAL
jgi:hypothetical protein